MEVRVREYDADEFSFEVLTEFLNLAYQTLLNQGLRFVAASQGVDVTRARLSAGNAFVAVLDGKLIGTITVYTRPIDSKCMYYQTRNLAVFGQFGVHPDFRGNGIGALLIQAAENFAIGQGIREMALDTAEPATGLIEYYRKQGYEIVGRTRWESVNYESVIMSKRLQAH